jgi:hypothetical protein
LRKLESRGTRFFCAQWQKSRDVDEEAAGDVPAPGFVRCGRRAKHRPIRSTPALSGLVTFGPAFPRRSMKPPWKRFARWRTSGRALDETLLPFQAGDSVAIADGPLRGMSGIVSAVAEERVT